MSGEIALPPLVTLVAFVVAVAFVAWCLRTCRARTSGNGVGFAINVVSALVILPVTWALRAGFQEITWWVKTSVYHAPVSTATSLLPQTEATVSVPSARVGGTELRSSGCVHVVIAGAVQCDFTLITQPAGDTDVFALDGLRSHLVNPDGMLDTLRFVAVGGQGCPSDLPPAASSSLAPARSAGAPVRLTLCFASSAMYEKAEIPAVELVDASRTVFRFERLPLRVLR